MKKFIDFLYYLRDHEIPYVLDQRREDYILVDIEVSGERWEVEFSIDGEILVKRFGKVGEVEGEEILEYLFDNYSI